MNRIDLEGQHAIVTGAAQGIGRAIAERFLASGAAVSLWDMDADLVAEAAGQVSEKGRVAAVPMDVTDPDSVGRALAQSLADIGPAQILVNNAGIAGPTATTWEYPVDEWRRVLSIDLDGVFHCCRAVVPTLIDQGFGRIVNIASIAGKEGNPTAPAYSAAKAGVIALTKSLGKELAGHDIAVNCVTPAAARTRIFEQVTDEFVNYMLSKIPRRRFVTVEEVAALVAWLASRECSFTTGGVFDISGGRATY